ncbi:DEAD/DEAH box helicase [Lactococcus garvieae]|uniref:DEAD/DEAH box helicase n=1 Tax=Lactococcus garvieae TaxID=1363 RepID=UPI00254FA5C2|nr:type ISP restriction/modification enzyme [Lactococcus garvieae]
MVKDFFVSFDSLIQQINDNNVQQRDRGTAFEYLVQAYLKNEPIYKNLYSEVWMLSEVPSEYGIPTNDIGVDLVAQKRTGELVAVQAKFYDHKIQKSDIDSFLSELGKDYYSEGIIVSTVDEWGKNAEEAINNRSDVSRIGLSNLRHSQINWEQWSFETPEDVQVKSNKEPRNYQKEVVEKSLAYFKDYDRGQLIMAPGTGKTFTSLKVAEALAKESGKDNFKILYLVPSIQLLTQTLRAWNNDTEMSMSSMAVTSDRNASRRAIKQDESNLFVKSSDIGFPATTSTEKVLENYEELKNSDPTELLVVYSTYQSIDVLGKAQKEGFPDFDLIIADEAHRTTGATALGDEDSAFVKVHNDNNIKGDKRLYQTATPKIYGADAKSKGQEMSVAISSMDDEAIYGQVIYRLGFGDAITRDILTDYKLMVLAVDEQTIQKDMQKSLSDPENGLNLDDVGRIIGVWNGMLKRETFSNNVSGSPMKRAIAFSQNIKASKRLTDQFETVVNEYLEDNDDENRFTVHVEHADGSMNALEKNNKLDWLADKNLPENQARILSNVRFLTEGIDVPNLDAIIFMSPRKSQVDIVQAVGRIIRKSEGKDYGYIILPIVIPAGETPENILDNNKSYDVVWQVLNALRSVDERFEATVNKLQLNKKKPENIQVIGVGGAPDDGEGNWKEGNQVHEEAAYQTSFQFDWEEIEGAIYGKIVQKVGDRRYLEDWSKDVSKIAQRHISYINTLLLDNSQIKTEFEKFLASLKHNINNSISETQAIEMLAQHLITKPIFDALFDEYSVVRNNPVNDAMEAIITEFSKYGFQKEQKELEAFYESVRLRAEGIDNAEAKQKIIVTLYDKFFRTGFKSTTERLGIVFTPIEVVDFIIHSVDDVLRKYFGKTIASKGVHILDPFTGTGTFITRTLQYLKGLMDKGEITLYDILQKYTEELHANEIILLSYYIAAINIEAVFDEINGDELDYEPFEGIVLTDTFESTEKEETLDDDFFGGNDERLKRQQEVPITVIMGNPPYSKGQSSENDNNKNIEYPKLFESVANSYVKHSKASSVLSMYDSYVLSLRWASNRLSNNGVIGFVSNASYIDSQSADGLRYSLSNEFNHLYIFNLRGDQRTVGEQSRKEGGKIFGSGSRTPIAISILVKDGSDNHEVHYHDIGDYLNREQKLSILRESGTIENIDWTTIIPDKNNDWVNQRDSNYENYRALADEDNAYFGLKDIGIVTNRDAWVSNFSKNQLIDNVQRMISNYNVEVSKLKDITEKLNDKTVVPFVTSDETKISWSRSLKQRAARKEKTEFDSGSVMVSMYRPFTKKYLYRNRFLNENVRKTYQTFPEKNTDNLFINVSGTGTKNGFSTLLTKNLLDMNAIYPARNLPRFTYEMDGMFAGRTDNIVNDDEFYYVYGVLHSPEYRKKYANDLQKALPRIPLLKNNEKFVEIGRKLADLHLNYEYQPSWEGVKVSGENSGNFKVKKMKHPKKGVLDTIIFNENITISNIPKQAYEYVVNGRSAIAWILDQYQVKTDKKSGIIDDPNEFSDNPRYILDLLLSVITVSMKTVELVGQLPKMEVLESE